MNAGNVARPRVSILIVCYRHVDLLLGCLQSLERDRTESGVSRETIVLFNGTPDEDRDRVQSRVQADQVLVSRVNLGFGGGNNRAARAARGEYLVLLNDDTEVVPGWLQALVNTADGHPDAGAVGSRILHADGTLQEAGSIIWSDASTLGVGRGLPPGTRRYDYLREVDYASACSLLVRRDAFEAIGGFDERFFPGYNEDVDLCLALVARGQRVLYQPRSVVLHHESQTGADAKTFLILRGRALLREKWAPQLERLAAATPLDPERVELAVHRARRSPRRVLIVDDRLPSHGAGSGFGRMLDCIRELAAAGYALSIYPTATAEGDRSEFQDLGVDVIEDDLAAHLLRPGIFYDVAIVSRPHNLYAVDLLRRRQGQCAIIYDAEALYHRRLEREAELTASVDPAGSKRALAGAARWREVEAQLVRTVDRIVSVSTLEADFLRSLPSACPVDVIEPLNPQARMTPRPFTRRRGMVFVAGWLAPYPSPNSDGLTWFMRDVMPMVTDSIPWARLTVTGANPHQELRSFEGPWLRFTGHVDDLAKLYDETRLAIVPARFGAGIKIKAIEALQYGVPVVSTAVGAEGIDGAGGAALAAHDDPAAFARRIIELLSNRRAWDSAREAIRQIHVGWHASRAAWTPIVETALREKTIGKLALHG